MPAIPDPALVVLVGASGAGKSFWAAAHYRHHEVVSSDALRAVVSDSERELSATDDAFALLDQIVAARSGRGLTTVVDTLGLDAGRRRGYLDQARRAGLPAVVVLLDVDPAQCRRRNRARPDPLPGSAIEAQLHRMQEAAGEVAAEGWDLVVHPDDAVVVVPTHSAEADIAAARQHENPVPLKFVLQVSRFPWGDQPNEWLTTVAAAAEQAGFHGVALMDHLIQIPQVGRAWEPIPEPWVTLGLLAGRTQRLQLGTLVSPVTYRPAGVLAKTVATLDALSGGRAFCGIGAGWWEREHAAFGLPFPPARERLDELETTAETLRALWQTGTKAYDGDRVHLPETTCYPRPVTKIPLIIGGSGERRTLRIVARFADACNLPSDRLVLEDKLAVLRAHCREIDRDPDSIEVTVLDLPIVGDSRDQAAGIVERLRGRTPTAAFAKRHHAGPAVDHVGRYRQLAEDGVRTVFVALPDLAGPDEVTRFAPVTGAFA